MVDTFDDYSDIDSEDIDQCAVHTVVPVRKVADTVPDMDLDLKINQNGKSLLGKKAPSNQLNCAYIYNTLTLLFF